MNWEFFIGQSILLIISGITAFYAVLMDGDRKFAKQNEVQVKNMESINERFLKQNEEQGKALLHMRAEFESEIEKCQKIAHENKGAIFARVDLLKLEAEKVYMRQDMANEKLMHLEERTNSKITTSLSLLQQEFSYVKNELIKMQKQ